jgi:hypothetical protein
LLVGAKIDICHLRWRVIPENHDTNDSTRAKQFWRNSMALLTTAQQRQLHQLIEMKRRVSLQAGRAKIIYMLAFSAFEPKSFCRTSERPNVFTAAARAVNPVASPDDNKIQGSNLSRVNRGSGRGKRSLLFARFSR